MNKVNNLNNLGNLNNLTKTILVLLLVVSLAHGLIVEGGYPNYASLNYLSFNYDPLPVSPGSKFDAWVKFQSIGDQPTQNATVMLELGYPFYLENSEIASKSFGAVLPNAYLSVPYRIRVREDAAEGDYNLTIRYASRDFVYLTKDVTVNVAKVDTDFDVAVQDYARGELSLAISNIGKNSANAVTIVSFGGYKAIIGNLNAGDYTVVAIPVSQETLGSPGEKKLNVEINYTDLNGNRRTTTKTIAIPAAQLSSRLTGLITTGATGASGTTGDFQGRRPDSNANLWFYSTIVLVLGILGYAGYNKFRRRREE